MQVLDMNSGPRAYAASSLPMSRLSSQSPEWGFESKVPNLVLLESGVVWVGLINWGCL